MAEQTDTLIAKLDELESRFAEVENRMNDPAVATDPNQIIALSKERARLGKIVDPYREYVSLKNDLEEARQILSDDDADEDFKELAQMEFDDLQGKVEAAIEEVKGLLVMSDEGEISSVMMELRAGTGGDEAALFVGNLLDMYQRYAEIKGWKFEILSGSPTELGGFREVIANISGDGVWSHLGYEGGGHRVQRVPQTESQGRIHTSAATVAVLPEPEEVEIDIDWDKDVVEHVSRASGPGGQSVNKIESAVKLEHPETGITVSMRDEKSQHKNRAKARKILAARVYEHFRSKQQAAEDAARKAMIGSGDRSQRVRTYNFPQGRCTDHRLKGEGQEGANFNLDRILAGNLDELIEGLIARDKAQRLANL
ncbi:MAG: peptide chain release factor 1 [Phycisphaerae bacterium]